MTNARRHQWTYRAGVISFAASDAPTEDQQAEVMDGFERLAFAGLDPEQYECSGSDIPTKTVSSFISAHRAWS